MGKGWSLAPYSEKHSFCMADLQIPSQVGFPCWKDSSSSHVFSEAKGNLQQELTAA